MLDHKSFFFKEERGSANRYNNIPIEVKLYAIDEQNKGSTILISSSKENSAVYRGASAVAAKLLVEQMEKAGISPDDYILSVADHLDIKLTELGFSFDHIIHGLNCEDEDKPGMSMS